MNAERPHPTHNRASDIRPDGQPASPPSTPEPLVGSGRVSGLDRATLQLGVAVAVVIALCSYAVSATSLYALGRQAGYAPWQAAAVPVVADGPAIYGMFRIISRSRRGAKGAGYGWLLVLAGTLASIAGNVAHAKADLVAQAIAAAIPLAVLAMLEALKGDASEIARLTGHATALDTVSGPDGPVGLGPPALSTTLRRVDPPAAMDAHRPDAHRPDGQGPDGPRVRQLPARPVHSDAGTVRQRLAAAYQRGRPDAQGWTARSLAEAAGCGRSSAAAFLQTQRTTQEEGP